MLDNGKRACSYNWMTRQGSSAILLCGNAGHGVEFR